MRERATYAVRAFVPITVTLELEWVLRSNFEFKKEETIGALSDLFSAAELPFESERALEVALDLYRGGTADFADCVHIALAVPYGQVNGRSGPSTRLRGPG